MNKRNIIILLIILGVALVTVLSFVIIPRLEKNPTIDPVETEAPYISNVSIIDTFSCITVTIGGDSKTSVNLCFTMMGELDPCVIEYEKANGDTTTAADFEKNQILTKETIYEEDTFFIPTYGQEDNKSPELDSENGFIHRAYIEGLESGTDYFYRIKSQSGKTSEIYKFTTADDDNVFSFLLVSDTQGFTQRNFDEWGETLKLATEEFPDYDFIIHMGDAVEDGKNLYQWQMMFNSCEDIIKNSTVVHVVGNQDKKYTLSRYTNGAQEDRTALVGGYYSFDYENIHFVVLNTGDGNGDIPKSQIKWLEKDLKASFGKESIILIHKAPYSNANHFEDEEIVAIRAQILPIAEEYGVKLVFEGHDHYFFRSLPITSTGEADYDVATQDIGGDETKLFSIHDNGTIYFMNGSAGCKQNTSGVSRVESILFDRAEMTDGPTFSYVTVDEDYIIIKTYIVLNSKVHLYDSFGIKLK